MGTSQNGQCADEDVLVREEISALMDNEVGAVQIERILGAMTEDAALQESWSRYHLVRDVLRRTTPPFCASSLPERVAVALAARSETLVSTRPVQRMGRFRRHRKGALSVAALAASFVLFAVLLVVPQQTSTLQSGVTIVRISAGEDNELPTVAADTDRHFLKASQLTPYLVNHSEYLAGSGMGGVVPFIHVVSHGD